MPHEDIFKEPILRTYRSITWSSAWIYMKFINFIRIFLPLFLIFISQGLWKKTGTFIETPNISFDGNFVIHLPTPNGSLVSSTYPVLTAAASNEQLTVAQLTNYQNERTLFIDIQLSTANKTINSIICALSTTFKLDYHSIVNYNLMLIDTIHLPFPTSHILINGRLDVDQSKPFEPVEHWQHIDPQRYDASHYQINSILDRQTTAPLSYEIKRRTTQLIESPHLPPIINLSFQLYLDNLNFTYRTTTFELLKWAWIQYFSIYVIINHLLTSLTSYIFENRLIYARTEAK